MRCSWWAVNLFLSTLAFLSEPICSIVQYHREYPFRLRQSFSRCRYNNGPAFYEVPQNVWNIAEMNPCPISRRFRCNYHSRFSDRRTGETSNGPNMSVFIWKKVGCGTPNDTMVVGKFEELLVWHFGAGKFGVLLFLFELLVGYEWSSKLAWVRKWCVFHLVVQVENDNFGTSISRWSSAVGCFCIFYSPTYSQ